MIGLYFINQFEKETGINYYEQDEEGGTLVPIEYSKWLETKIIKNIKTLHNVLDNITLGNNELAMEEIKKVL